MSDMRKRQELQVITDTIQNYLERLHRLAGDPSAHEEMAHVRSRLEYYQKRKEEIKTEIEAESELD